MRPIKEKGFQDANSSGNITWTGPCIACLEIETNQNLNAVMYTIASKVCELTAPLDLSTLTLQCALDIFNREETGNRTLTNVFQLLIDNDCGLKELIDNLQSQIDGIAGTTLVLDLKCLAEKDSFGNSLPYTEKTVLQTLINNICSLTDDIAKLSGNYIILKDIVDNLDIPSGDEIEISTCTSPFVKPVSQSVIELSSDYCEYKGDVGTSAQIQTAISRQLAEFNTLMSSVAGWVVPSDPTNFSMAQSLNNIWLLIKNFSDRIKANEKCCANSCDDISLGFITDIEGTSAILRFTSGAGTFIPVGYTDCGSLLTVTNSRGLSLSTAIVVSQGGETDEIDLSSFTIGEILSFNIDLKMCSETESCQKCINKDVKYSNSNCCVLTNSGGSDLVITYSSLI